MGSAEIGSRRCAGEEGWKNVWKKGKQGFVEISWKLFANRGVDRLGLIVKYR